MLAICAIRMGRVSSHRGPGSPRLAERFPTTRRSRSRRRARLRSAWSHSSGSARSRTPNMSNATCRSDSQPAPRRSTPPPQLTPTSHPPGVYMFFVTGTDGVRRSRKWCTSIQTRAGRPRRQVIRRHRRARKNVHHAAAGRKESARHEAARRAKSASSTGSAYCGLAGSSFAPGATRHAH